MSETTVRSRTFTPLTLEQFTDRWNSFEAMTCPREPKIYLPLLDNGNGQVMASFMIDFFEAFKGRDVELARASDSHANRGMNKIANDFMASKCDVWINIDADIRFRAIDVDALLSHNLPLVYGVYPKKEDAANPCVCSFKDIEMRSDTPLVEMRRCGRGFMLVRREVLEAMKEDNGGPALRYHNHGRVEWDFFPSGVVTGRQSFYGTAKKDAAPEEIEHPLDEDGYPKREWISEDWYFCERARELGFDTMVDSRVALGHVGAKEYRFGSDQLVRMDGNIKDWREIHGWFDYEEFYRQLVKEIPDGGRFAEVGCWLGRSLGAFAAFAKEEGKTIELHAIDTFIGDPANAEQEAVLTVHGPGGLEKHFRENMAAMQVPVQIHAKSSLDGAKDFEDGSLDAVFIDASHIYDDVLSDILAWYRKVKHGGILCGHDIDEEGVSAAVRKIFNDGFETHGRCWLVRT